MELSSGVVTARKGGGAYAPKNTFLSEGQAARRMDGVTWRGAVTTAGATRGLFGSGLLEAILRTRVAVPSWLELSDYGFDRGVACALAGYLASKSVAIDPDLVVSGAIGLVHASSEGWQCLELAANPELRDRMLPVRFCEYSGGASQEDVAASLAADGHALASLLCIAGFITSPASRSLHKGESRRLYLLNHRVASAPERCLVIEWTGGLTALTSDDSRLSRERGLPILAIAA